MSRPHMVLLMCGLSGVSQFFSSFTWVAPTSLCFESRDMHAHCAVKRILLLRSDCSSASLFWRRDTTRHTGQEFSRKKRFGQFLCQFQLRYTRPFAQSCAPVLSTRLQRMGSFGCENERMPNINARTHQTISCAGERVFAAGQRCW
jgi:hypothetical protein